MTDKLRENLGKALECELRELLRTKEAPYMDLAEACQSAARAALAAPQPAPAPAADERAAMIEAIEAAVDGTELVDGEPWGSDTIADALLAVGYRKAAALLAERDALIHDIERAKESESALLAELEQARGIVRQGSRVNSG